MKLPVRAAAAPIQCALLSATLGLSGAAMAQSSVTIFGTADAGIGKIEYGTPADNPAARRTQMIAGSAMNNGTSHVGLRGVEDLGGGLKVGFNFETNLSLENGNNLTTGSGGGFWGRSARLYVEGGWGQLEMGRTYVPSFLAMISWQLTGSANYSVVGSTYNWGGAGVRTNSMIGYRTPRFGDFSAHLGYVMKPDNGDVSRWDATLKYAAGPIVATLGVNKVQNAKAGYSLGGRYNFGGFAVAASYNQATRGDARRRGFSLGGQATMGAATLTLDATRDTKNEWASKKYTNALLEGRYALSKRTFVYAAYLRLDGTNNYGLGVRHNF